MEVPILGQPKGEPVTVDHPIFEEIGHAIAELLNRTQLLAMGQAALTQVLVDKGLIDNEEEESGEGSPAA